MGVPFEHKRCDGLVLLLEGLVAVVHVRPNRAIDVPLEILPLLALPFDDLAEGLGGLLVVLNLLVPLLDDAILRVRGVDRLLELLLQLGHLLVPRTHELKRGVLFLPRVRQKQPRSRRVAGHRHVGVSRHPQRGGRHRDQSKSEEERPHDPLDASLSVVSHGEAARWLEGPLAGSRPSRVPPPDRNLFPPPPIELARLLKT